MNEHDCFFFVGFPVTQATYREIVRREPSRAGGHTPGEALLRSISDEDRRPLSELALRHLGARRTGADVGELARLERREAHALWLERQQGEEQSSPVLAAFEHRVGAGGERGSRRAARRQRIDLELVVREDLARRGVHDADRVRHHPAEDGPTVEVALRTRLRLLLQVDTGDELGLRPLGVGLHLQTAQTLGLRPGVRRRGVVQVAAKHDDLARRSRGALRVRLRRELAATADAGVVGQVVSDRERRRLGCRGRLDLAALRGVGAIASHRGREQQGCEQ
jgi:hypothetical protein